MSEKERDEFFEFFGITKEEEGFFKKLYKRRQFYRGTIYILILIIAILITLLCMR